MTQGTSAVLETFTSTRKTYGSSVAMNTSFARETACSWCLRSLAELLHMLVDEADTEKHRFASRTLGNWVLTILTAGLTYQGGSRDNDANKFQGNYDYD